MREPQGIAQAGLVGWRKAIADRVALRPRAVSEKRVRAAIGVVFFLLSLYHVVRAIAHMPRSAQN